MKYYNFPQRLEREMSDWGISQTALAPSLRVTQAAVSRWLKGEVSPRVEVAKRLADLLGVRVEWLASGDGDKLNERSARSGEQIIQGAQANLSPARKKKEDSGKEEASVAPNHAAELRATAARLLQMADELEKGRLFLPSQIAGNPAESPSHDGRDTVLRDKAMVSLPVFGSVPAGPADPICAEHLALLNEVGAALKAHPVPEHLRNFPPLGTARVSARRFRPLVSERVLEESFCLRVRGDSMNRAKPEPISDGDVVVVVPAEVREPRSGDIVVALIDEGMTLKRLVNGDTPAHLVSESDDPAYGNILPRNSLTVQGVVVGKLTEQEKGAISAWEFPVVQYEESPSKKVHR